MSPDQIASFLVIAILVFFTFLSASRLIDSDRRRTAEVTRMMKAEFFPQLEVNLNEIRKKLETFEGGKYVSIPMRGLSTTLSVEFKLRLHHESSKLDQLQDDLAEYEKELVEAENNQDSKITEKVKALNSELRMKVDELITNIHNSSKLESLPAKQLAYLK